MLRTVLLALSLLCTSAFVQAAPAESSQPEATAADDAFAKLPWIVGPADGKIGNTATLHLGQNGRFLGTKGTEKFLELTGNLPTPDHYTLVTQDGEWFAVFSFDDAGYVKDDEKIDADALLKSMQEGEEENNAELKKRGLSTLHLEGWHVPPHYDSNSKQLEWATRIRDDKGNVSVNYTIRILGRHGYTSATLVSDPQSLDKDIVAFRDALKGFEYNSGEKYSEFKAGDHVAEIGLGALIAGGAAAAAVKSGLLTKLLANVKLVILAIGGALAALWAGIKRLFGKKD